MLNFVKFGINFPSFTLLKCQKVKSRSLSQISTNFPHNHVITITNIVVFKRL